jgi:hypothetical protein
MFHTSLVELCAGRTAGPSVCTQLKLKFSGEGWSLSLLTVHSPRTEVVASCTSQHPFRTCGCEADKGGS